MDFEPPATPKGTGQHPVMLIQISVADLTASSAFYSRLFGWHPRQLSFGLTAVPPAGPVALLRSGLPAATPGIVPYIGAGEVEGILAGVVAAGGAVEEPASNLPGVGTLARFRDPGGTLYGVTDSVPPGGVPPLPVPFGSPPPPPVGALCSLEMFAGDLPAAARFFGDVFGWGTVDTMPQYLAFSPGAGVDGVFQSHTPSLPALAYIYSANVESTLAEIETAGGRRLGDPMRVPGLACFGYFNDVSGTSMGLIGP